MVIIFADMANEGFMAEITPYLFSAASRKV